MNLRRHYPENGMSVKTPTRRSEAVSPDGTITPKNRADIILSSFFHGLWYTCPMSQTSPHHPLTSKENSAVKQLQALAEPKQRKKEQAFLIEGVKMVEEALRDNSGVKLVVAAPSLVQHHGRGVLKLAESRSVEILWVSEKLMDAISESSTPQPVLAVLKMPDHSDHALFAHASGLIVVAHQLQDPGNLGTIIRTAEAVGAAGIALTPNTVDPFSAKAVRASMGSILRLPVVRIGDIRAFIQACTQNAFQTAAAALTGEQSLFDVDLKKPTAVILGQEGGGLPHDILTAVDLRVRIPMAVSIDSLNVATSAAVILYEAMRQRIPKNALH
jgi:TrmH family RNA methyltransferase